MSKLRYVPSLFCAILMALAQPPAWADQPAFLVTASCTSATLTCAWQSASDSTCKLSKKLSGDSCTSDGTGILSSDGTLSRCKQQVQIDQNCTTVTTLDPFDHFPPSASSNPPPDPCPNTSPTVQGFSGDDGSPAPTGCAPSPIIIDIGEEGFHLTSAQHGVAFDIAGTGHTIQLAWTDPHFRNAFLALPGPDGLVHNGKELFGNFTPQPPSNHPNGFIALAEYDKPENGGNGDGIIDERDAVFSHLRLWIDENHDGISQLNELHTLPELGVSSISLMYHPSRKEDEYGNLFRYRARVNPIPPDDQAEVGKTAYDVFFVTK
ncbi:MAG TPA: hypothetical protein VHA33_15495 [Candidatus Angelobacter sp.]|jgi:hypothetical protein|nr:hypothetical protein [Candidatus Angelobacter sp.]